jgi:hypothetical protein
MFNLEKAIVEWRRQMSAGGIKTPVPLIELESHLRDDVERQMRLGLSEQQAFEISARRIGQANKLEAEFKKANNAKEARAGKVIGIACCAFAGLFSLWMTPWLLTVHELSMPVRMYGLSAVALIIVSIVSWKFSHKYLPVIRDHRTRMAAGVACCLTGVIWLFVFFGELLPDVIVPRILSGAAGEAVEFAFMIAISTLWAVALTSVLGGIAYGLEEAARRRSAMNVS